MALLCTEASALLFTAGSGDAGTRAVSWVYQVCVGRAQLGARRLRAHSRLAATALRGDALGPAPCKLGRALARW